MEKLTQVQRETLAILSEKKGKFTDTEVDIYWQLINLLRSEQAAQQLESQNGINTRTGKKNR
jgi:hypothetical protein